MTLAKRLGDSAGFGYRAVSPTSPTLSWLASSFAGIVEPFKGWLASTRKAPTPSRKASHEAASAMSPEDVSSADGLSDKGRAASRKLAFGVLVPDSTVTVSSLQDVDDAQRVKLESQNQKVYFVLSACMVAVGLCRVRRWFFNREPISLFNTVPGLVLLYMEFHKKSLPIRFQIRRLNL